jgi:hypothetical protein
MLLVLKPFFGEDVKYFEAQAAVARVIAEERRRSPGKSAEELAAAVAGTAIHG